MENLDSVLRSLRVDWDNTTSPHYNPLPLALDLSNPSSSSAIKYRNTFHRLESSMQRIIEMTFKGFSDSVISYKKSFNNINYCIEKLEDVKREVEEIKRALDVKVPHLVKTERDICEKRVVLQRLQDIGELKGYLQSKEDNITQACINITKCLNLFESLKDIKTVKLLQPEIEEKQRNILHAICKAILDFVFAVDDSKLAQLSGISVLNSLESIDQRLAREAKQVFVRRVQSIILDVGRSKTSTISLNSVDSRVPLLAKRLSRFFRLVISNFDQAVLKIESSYVKKANFFEKDFEEREFFSRDKFICLLKSQIYKIINVYAVNEFPEEDNIFNLKSVEDDCSYFKYFPGKFLADNEGCVSLRAEDSEFPLLFEPNYQFLYFLYEDLFPEMKEEIKRLLNVKYFSTKEKKIDKKLYKLFSGDVLEVKDSRLKFYSKLKLMIDANDVYGAEFGYKIFVRVFESTVDALDGNIESLFRCKHITEALVIEEEKDKTFSDLSSTVEERKSLLSMEVSLARIQKVIQTQKIEIDDLMFTKQKYSQVKAAIKTISEIKEMFITRKVKYEEIQIDSLLSDLLFRIEEVEKKYRICFDLEIILDIFYYFDRFVNSGDFGRNSTFLKFIVDIVKDLNEINQEGEIKLVGLFKCINFYIAANREKFKINSKEDLHNFIEDLKMLEDIICNFNMEYGSGFEESLTFFIDILNKKLDSPQKKAFYSRISK